MPTSTSSLLAERTPAEVDIKERLYDDLNYFGDMVIRSNGLDRIKFWNHFEVRRSQAT
jgi:hypothetical protein